jgi:predicted kinase
LERIPPAIDTVKPELDHFFAISNNDGQELVGDEWATFTSICVQTRKLIPGNKLTRAVKAVMAVKKKGRHRRISLYRSSEDNHLADDMKFYGRYAHIRSTLDYSHHQNYRRDRQIFQDAIISDFFEEAVIKDKNGELCTTPTEPWLVFTAGAMGAGKGYTKTRLVDKGLFPLMSFVNVDPDEVRRRLPEYYLYINEVPELAGELTRKEAGLITEILALAALQAGKNVLIDGSLRDSDWYQGYFARLRREFPAIRIAIIHITAPREAVFQRAAVSYSAIAHGLIIAPISLIFTHSPQRTVQYLPGESFRKICLYKLWSRSRSRSQFYPHW